MKKQNRNDLEIVEQELKRLVKKHPNAASMCKKGYDNHMHRGFFADLLRENIPDVDETNINTAIISQFED